MDNRPSRKYRRMRRLSIRFVAYQLEKRTEYLEKQVKRSKDMHHALKSRLKYFKTTKRHLRQTQQRLLLITMRTKPSVSKAGVRSTLTPLLKSGMRSAFLSIIVLLMVR
jgi:ribosome-binding ATPase YchF (GTP1/OBG family)